MTDTTKTKDTAGGKAAEEKDLIARLADAGEEALHKLTELPGGQRAVSAANELRARVDDLAKKVRGIDALEERIAALEKEVASLKRKVSATRKPSSP